jgi:hypothetical protein
LNSLEELFGGEGLFYATPLPWNRLHTITFSRLADRIIASAPKAGGSRGEGSVLGGLGNLLDGDNRYLFIIQQYCNHKLDLTD